MAQKIALLFTGGVTGYIKHPIARKKKRKNKSHFIINPECKKILFNMVMTRKWGLHFFLAKEALQ